MTVLGNAPPAKVVINEMTTIASVWTNNQFITSTAIKGPPLALRIAAGNVLNFVDLTTGGYARERYCCEYRKAAHGIMARGAHKLNLGDLLNEVPEHRLACFIVHFRFEFVLVFKRYGPLGGRPCADFVN